MIKKLLLLLLVIITVSACAAQPSPARTLAAERPLAPATPSLPAPTAAPTLVSPTATLPIPSPTAIPATATPLTLAPPIPAPAGSLLVGAYWYPWYDSNGRHWKQGYRGQPTLGQYASGDPKVISQQIDWATGAGINFLVTSWWGKDSFEDKIISSQLVTPPLNSRIKFGILYETNGLLKKTGDNIDMDDPANRTKFVQDMSYVATTYFKQPNYLSIGNRPVIFIYLTRIYTGNFAQALSEARTAVKSATGQDVFIIGDEVYWQAPTAARLKLFDGVTGYNMHTARPDIADGFAQKELKQYQVWAGAARAAGVLFAPGVIPGFDDLAVRPEMNHPVIPRSPEMFRNEITGAIPLAEGAARMLLVNSWNEWHEYTSIEPSKEFGTSYLDVLREALQQ